jgi:hypothetical protein
MRTQHALLGYWSGIGGEFTAEWGSFKDANAAEGLGAANVPVVPSAGILAVEPQLSWDPLFLNK